MCPDNNAKMYPDKSQGKNVPVYPGNNVNLYLAKLARLSLVNNARMYQGKWRDKIARTFLVNNARTYPVKSATNKLVMAVKKYLINPAQCLGFLFTLQSCYAVQKTSFISILQ